MYVVFDTYKVYSSREVKTRACHFVLPLVRRRGALAWTRQWWSLVQFVKFHVLANTIKSLNAVQFVKVYALANATKSYSHVTEKTNQHV
jgi:hypothetical protein